ncbi:transcription elongation factor [Xanthomarina sp. F2636L]|uniref:transcription elongation factor n=1 Tax=Xanthomarina sp. F2636L TaxID=2996018 RepID=UPI00225DD6B2|nr:transcription elongation factor [Xanthomarina sp. F2636L]MCX7549550.1 transcription elongation factor [Xanthomarina sp. F2636L]
MNLKEQLLQACYGYVNKRIASYKDEIETIKEAIENNDKSNDEGDDSGNGKLFNDLELNAQYLSDANKMLDTIKLINSKTSHTNVVLGSLVKTTSNNFFMSISIGKIEIENASYFGISLSSPIGLLIKNKVVGDSITFNNNTFTITEIK